MSTHADCPACGFPVCDCARRDLADAKAHHMDAPGGPRCACGLPSAHESGACRRCVALAEAQARATERAEELVGCICDQERELMDARREAAAAQVRLSESRLAALAVVDCAGCRDGVRVEVRDQQRSHVYGEHDWRHCPLSVDAHRALAAPADRAALDALLAQARAKGVQACVDAARAAAGAGFTSDSVLAAVERAAREAAGEEATGNEPAKEKR